MLPRRNTQKVTLTHSTIFTSPHHKSHTLDVTVLDDIVCAMFAKKFMDELMIPQEIYSGVQIQELFKKVAHASIMKLNDHSMQKLFELMIMTFKYQFIGCTKPDDIMKVTDLHFEGIKALLVPDSVSISLVKSIQGRVRTLYKDLSNSDWQDVKETLYMFFYDRRVRISLLLKSKDQNADGTMSIRLDGPVSDRTDFPGIVKYTNMFGDERIETLSALSIRHIASPKNESIPEWKKKLGSNMYDDEEMDVLGAVCDDADLTKEDESRTRSLAAKSALSLLSDIIRDRKDSSSSSNSRSKPILIDFDDSVRFLKNNSDVSSKRKDDDDLEEEVRTTSASINISASSGKYRKNVKKYRDDLFDDENDGISSAPSSKYSDASKNDDDDDDDDLLAMMDSACSK